MAQLTCPCGTRFEAASPRARYCSAACRKRASRAGVVSTATTAPKPPVAPPAPLPDVDGDSVTGSVIAELASANVLRSPAGLAAVKLAQLIDSATLMQGTSVAAWTREMRAALADAKQEAPAKEHDPINDLERKRAARRGA